MTAQQLQVVRPTGLSASLLYGTSSQYRNYGSLFIDDVSNGFSRTGQIDAGSIAKNLILL